MELLPTILAILAASCLVGSLNARNYTARPRWGLYLVKGFLPLFCLWGIAVVAHVMTYGGAARLLLATPYVAASAVYVLIRSKQERTLVRDLKADDDIPLRSRVVLWACAAFSVAAAFATLSH